MFNILTGMRISIGIAWLVIVAAEILFGGTGIGYFVWNEWSSITKSVENLSKRYSETGAPVFGQVSFRMNKGEFVCIIDHSGCR